ncbi:hypothetical protein SAPIO_CDS7886 [Scedosporium apiospermum]|uniref:Major facilitator superfamily transporter n=1 Tax=Pseudallescheria apiosperma TaxID=563466 RepID=A0A084G0M7_PSEDA|nr:uncharacterized protein SAPIO_CDS7886 [Scedosporium apiospermum]KEZ40889.1 hypothetical protein SAPIO_CDS7886 [Scedosporium apiospermum]
MSVLKPIVTPAAVESPTPSDGASLTSQGKVDDKHLSDLSPPPAPALATRESERMEAALGDAILRLLRIRKGPKGEEYDLDAVGMNSEPEWENKDVFDPNFRWTWREERAVRHKVDWKIMVWVCIMFAALNIDRGNISNAVSDDMLDDLGLTRVDYNIGQTISRVGFLVAELPSQLISKRIGPDIWIPIQICIFSIISAMQFFLKGRASFLATRYLIATFQGGFIPDTILYLSYWYTGRRLPIRLAWFWMSSQLVDIGVGFAAVGLLSMRGILGYEGWRWLFLIEGAFTFIRDDPQKGGMHNRQGLSVRQIWECAKDYDMWPLYALGLLFGLPKYPIGQYLTLSFRGLGFNVIESNLLSIPNVVGSSLNMLLITAISELVNNRSFVSMAEDAWLLPCFAALIALPDPINPWSYFAIATVLLAFPYRNAGSVQNRTVSASLYNMFVQVSGMIGANKDSPRYFKANKGLLVICIWMCVIQYPGTYFYYRWRNHSKAKKWDAMTPDEQDNYIKTTTDVGNKRLDFRFAT